MKTLVAVILFLMLPLISPAQTTSEVDEVKEVIERFFEGFHARDSVVMKSAFHEEPIIHVIGRTQSGDIRLNTEELENVLKGIVSIPLETDFNEVLESYDIKIDGNMANAWTPYSFYVDDSFSHCGVNNFQLLKQKGEWKIIYLIDTRRREGCDGKKLE